MSAKNGKTAAAPKLSEKEAKLVQDVRERFPQLNETQALHHLKDHNNSVSQTIDALLQNKGERWHTAAGKKDKPKAKPAAKESPAPAPKDDRPRDFKPRTDRPPRADKKPSPAPVEEKKDEKKEPAKPAASISVAPSAWGSKVSSGMTFADRLRKDPVAEAKAEAEAKAKAEEEAKAAEAAKKKAAAEAKKKKDEEEAAKKAAAAAEAAATPAKKPQHQINTPPPRTAPAGATVEITPARFADPASPMGAGAAAPPPTPAAAPQSATKAPRPAFGGKPFADRPRVSLPAHVTAAASKSTAPTFSSMGGAAPAPQEPAAPAAQAPAAQAPHHQAQPTMMALQQQLGLQNTMQNPGFQGAQWGGMNRAPAGYQQREQPPMNRPQPANATWNAPAPYPQQQWNRPMVPQQSALGRMPAGFSQNAQGGQW